MISCVCPSPVQLSLPGSMRVVSGFDRIYHAAQLHFHWGSVEEPGSEHTIDNVHFPAEVRRKRMKEKEREREKERQTGN